jgi:CheY-like chemotaxis protein
MNVLVADDDRVTRLILGRILTAEFGCAVTEVADGTDVLEALTTQTFDLLLLDLQMPVMGGLDTMRAIRQAPSLRGLPVVVLTADRSEETVRQVREFGVVDYLTKPLNADRIVQRLRRVLARPGDKGPAAEGEHDPVLGAAGSLLVIDGHTDFRQAVASALSPRWVVHEAESGIRGLRLAVEDPPGAAVIGSDLGVLSEPLLVRKLRSLPSVRDVPLVAVVADRQTEAERLKSYDAAVVRSTDPGALLEQFEELTRGGAPLRGAERCAATGPGGETAPAA